MIQLALNILKWGSNFKNHTMFPFGNMVYFSFIAFYFMPFKNKDFHIHIVIFVKFILFIVCFFLL